MAVKKKTCMVASGKYCSMCRMYSMLTYLIAVLPVRLPSPPVSTSHHCAHILDVSARSLSCTLTASTRADNNICTYFFSNPSHPYVYMHACSHTRTCELCVCPLRLLPPPAPPSRPEAPERFCMLGRIMQHEAAKSPSNTFS